MRRLRGTLVSLAAPPSHDESADDICQSWCSPGNEAGAVRPIRTRLQMDSDAAPYAAPSWRHSARVAVLFNLNMSRRERLRSWLKWLKKEEWTATNFCRLRMRPKRCMALSLRRNGRCEFSTRLLSHRPHDCRPSHPRLRTGPNRFHQYRTVSWLMSMPRS